MDELNQNELIEQYVQGKLSGPQLTAFKNRLATDAAFRTEVALEQAVIRNLKTVGRAEMKTKLESFHAEITPAPYAPAPTEGALLNQLKEYISGVLAWLTAKPYLAMAAASVVILLISTLVFFNHRPGPAAIYAAYYEPYPLETYRSAPATDSLAAEAALAYQAGNYPRSITLFKQVLANKKDEKALFYLANAYLSAGRPRLAIRTYQTYLQNYQEFAPEASWYLGLSYVKAGQPRAAQKIFTALAHHQTPENEYQTKAAEILEKYNFKE